MKYQTESRPERLLKAGAIAGALAMLFASASLQAATMKPYWEFKKPKMIQIEGDLSYDTNGKSPPIFGTGAYVMGFEGVSQYDGAFFQRNFIPPDTMGAVGRTQYMSTTNGAYAVFDKATGNRTALMSDVDFWAKAGQTGANGDSRIMYNADASRWVAVSFGASTSDLQIAVSDTDNALGAWKSVKFTGYAGGTADYPTLALDKNAVYIGTNDFAPSFKGTTLNVIPIASVFNAGGPTVANMKQFVTPYNGLPGDEDRGFAIQGVNSRSAGSTGKVVAASLFKYDSMGYKVNGLSSTNATGSTTSGITYLGQAAYVSPGPGRQPSVAITANQRIIDTLDERISSSAYEANGKIYMVQTVNSGLDLEDEARVRYTVLDADSFAILSQGDIGEAGYDYYQGSIAVNEDGQVVIGYNRSGLNPATGKISFMAQSFNTDASGNLVALSGELLLKESLTDDYHNGSLYGQAAAGRQRWGDYSQVSVDPEDSSKFWVIGQFAREYNLPQFGHPNGTGGSRWGTWIGVIQVPAVPEPSTWAMMILGLGAMGGFAARRRRASERSLAA
jgi:hypothetical protein